MKILVKHTPRSRKTPLPQYMTEGASGIDLYADLSEPILLPPGERVLVPTGLSVAIPIGFEGQVRPRSGLAWKNGVTVLNTPGTVDADYRGEIQVILVNLGQENFMVTPGDRIAQLVITPIQKVVLETVAELPDTVRGDGGFGHTGIGLKS